MKNHLRKWRQRRRLPQVALAVKAKVAVGLVSAIERWNYLPGSSVRARLAAALAVEIRELWPSLSNDDRQSDESAFRGTR